MDFLMLKHPRSTFNNSNIKAFTLIEFMVSVSVTSILAAIAIPNLSDFIVQLRVDNEISSLHRMLLITRNAAINSGHKAIVCPLNTSFQCTGQWQDELSVFVDENNNKKLDANEKVIIKRTEIKTNDKLVYAKGRNKITFKPTGQLSGLANGTFRYCPQSYKKYSRGIVLARSGRMYQSDDIDNDGIDENRGNKEIKCE
jgi:type IV fimbrial biogenesis protein FimT